MNVQSGANANQEEEKHVSLNYMANRESMEVQSIVDNEMTSMKTKSRGNHIDKHCIVPQCSSMGKLISGKNWYKHNAIHLKDGTKREDIQCVDCKNDEACQKYHGLESRLGKHKMVRCSVCGQQKRADTFDIDGETCVCCAGKQGKSRTQISIDKKSQIGQGINKSIKRVNPDSNDVPPLLQADDSVSQCAFEQQNQLQVQVSSKVTNESLFNLQQHTFDFSGSLVNPSSDRDLLPSVPVFNNEPKIIYKQQKDPEQLALSKIIQLEKSDDSIQKKTFAILEISRYLVAPLIINFITSQNQPRIADILMEVQEQADQYSDEQITAIMIASTFLERSWCTISKNLDRVNPDKREYILTAMEAHLKKFISADIAEWICSNWQHLEEQTYHLAQSIKNSDQADIANQAKRLLIISRLVQLQKENIAEYLGITKVFITSDSVNLLIQGIDHVNTRSMNFNDYVLLLNEIQKNYNKELILEKKEALLELPPQAWLQWLSETKVQARIANADSVDGYYKKLAQKNGLISGLGGFIQAGDKQLRRIIHEAKIEPNNLQLAVTKYLVNLNKPLILCNVPSGQGKSRIAAAVSLVLLLKNKTQLIRMVFPNQHLMDRDKAEFEAYWILAGAAERVSYHIGLDFQMNASDALVIDEADLFIFANPVRFKNVIGKHRCICLTGTPDNCDLDGAERQILQALECAVVDSVVDNPEQAFELPEIKELGYDQDSQTFIQFIQDKLAVKPVILITSQDRLTQLDQSRQSYILIKNDVPVNAAFLRNLDSQKDGKQQYMLFVCIGDIGIRGLDFRSIRTGIAEIIDTPFVNMRSLFQGLKRVGRAGDPCEYYKTKRVQADLLDSNSVLQQKAMLLKSLVQLESLLQKRTAGQALPEKLSGSQKQSKLGQTRTNKLVGKQDGTLNKFFK